MASEHESGEDDRPTTVMTLAFRPRAIEDPARASWTRDDWKFFRRLARREGWT